MHTFFYTVREKKFNFFIDSGGFTHRICYEDSTFVNKQTSFFEKKKLRNFEAGYTRGYETKCQSSGWHRKTRNWNVVHNSRISFIELSLLFLCKKNKDECDHVTLFCNQPCIRPEQKKMDINFTQSWFITGRVDFFFFLSVSVFFFFFATLLCVRVCCFWRGEIGYSARCNFVGRWNKKKEYSCGLVFKASVVEWGTKREYDWTY